MHVSQKVIQKHMKCLKWENVAEAKTCVWETFSWPWNDSGQLSSDSADLLITDGEATQVVKLLCGLASGVDEVQPVFLKATGLSTPELPWEGLQQSTSSIWTCDSEGTIHLSPLDSTFCTLCGSVSAGGDLQLAPEWNWKNEIVDRNSRNGLSLTDGWVQP